MGGRATRKPGDPNEVGNIWDHYAVEYEYKNGVRLSSYCRHIPGDEDVSGNGASVEGHLHQRKRAGTGSTASRAARTTSRPTFRSTSTC